MEQEDIRNIQTVCYDILKEIDKICAEHHIEYSLSGGTALGSYRHQGFIPWDDDLDIIMVREEYEKFVDVLKNTELDGYYYHCYETDPRYNVLLPAMKFRKKNTYIQEVNKLLPHHCDGDGLFVDVFTYDHASPKVWRNELFMIGQFILGYFILLLDNLHIPHQFFKNWFYVRARNYSRKHQNSGYYVFSLTWVFSWRIHAQVISHDELFPFHLQPFEDGYYNMPNVPEKILNIVIGPDFRQLPPPDKRMPKHTVVYSTTSDQP